LWWFRSQCNRYVLQLPAIAPLFETQGNGAKGFSHVDHLSLFYVRVRVHVHVHVRNAAPHSSSWLLRMDAM
jgi:hypothetical protein